MIASGRSKRNAEGAIVTLSFCVVMDGKAERLIEEARARSESARARKTLVDP